MTLEQVFAGWFPGRPKDIVPLDCKFSVKMCNTWIKKDKVNKMISIENFNHNNILIDTDDKLSVDITLKNMLIVITFIIKDDGKFCPQIFLKITVC